MKARKKSTGEIVEVLGEGIQNSNMVMSAHGEWFTKDELDIVPLSWKPFEPTYWQKLEHQAAIAAMQGMLSNATVVTALVEGKSTLINTIPRQAKLFAHALVEKMKEEK